MVIYLNSSKLGDAALHGLIDDLKGFKQITIVVDDTSDETVGYLQNKTNAVIRYAREFIPTDFLEEIDSYAQELSRVIRCTGKHYLEFNKINLGDVIDHELYGHYFNTIQGIYTLDRVITAERPDALIKFSATEPYSEEICAMIEKKHHISIRVITADSNRLLADKFRGMLLAIANIASLFINFYVLRDLFRYYRASRNLRKCSNFGSPASAVTAGHVGIDYGCAKPLFAIDNANASCIDTVLPLFARFETKSIITDNLEVVAKLSQLTDCPIIFVSLFKPLFKIRAVAYLRYFYDLRHALRNTVCSIHGYDLTPLLLRDLQGIVLRRFPAILATITAMERIVKTTGIGDLVVLPTQCTEFDEVLINVAEHANISSLVVQHGILGRAFGFTPIITTAMALWGERDRQFLEKHGAEMEKANVVGCPRFDILINNSFNRQEILAKYSLPGTDIILLATTQMMAEYYKNNDLLNEMLRLLGSHANTHFIIKPHPSEDIGKYEQLLERYGIRNGIILKDADLNELIYISKLVITYPSTGPLHSMLLHKRTVLFGTDTIYSRYPLLTTIADVIDLPEKLKPLLDSMDCEPVDYEEVLHDFLYKCDGKAADRVIELINLLHATPTMDNLRFIRD